jgi:hypothetical protein
LEEILSKTILSFKTQDLAKEDLCSDKLIK